MTSTFKVSFVQDGVFVRLPASIRQDNAFVLKMTCDTVTEAAREKAKIAAQAGLEFDTVLVHMDGQESEMAIYTSSKAEALAPRLSTRPVQQPELKTVTYRQDAKPFADEMEARLACMEARGKGGICAGERASAFGTMKIEGEPGIYVQFMPEDASVSYLTRGVR